MFVRIKFHGVGHLEMTLYLMYIYIYIYIVKKIECIAEQSIMYIFIRRDFYLAKECASQLRPDFFLKLRKTKLTNGIK
jgi:hypothetical protein